MLRPTGIHKTANQRIRACEKILEKRLKSKQPSWISPNTIKLINEEGDLKARYKRTQNFKDKEEWREKQKEVSKAFDMDNKAHINSKLDALERAVNKHKHHKVWKFIHDISEKPKEPPLAKSECSMATSQVQTKIF